MIRSILTIGFLAITTLTLGQATEGSVKYKRSLYPAAVIELPYSESFINTAMSDFLSKKGKSKGTDMKGFSTFRNTDQINPDSTNADLYFKVDRKSRREKESSIISLLLVAPTNDASIENVLHLNMYEAKNYLNELASTLDGYNLESVIKEKNEEVIAAENKLKSISSSANDLEQKRLSLEKQVNDNKREQEAQQNEVNRLKQILAEWVAKRQS